MRDEEVVKHSAAVVSTKYVYPVIPGHDRVLAAFGTNKLLAARQLLPAVDRLGWTKVEDQILLLRVSLSLLIVRGRNSHGFKTLHEPIGLTTVPL